MLKFDPLNRVKNKLTAEQRARLPAIAAKTKEK